MRPQAATVFSSDRGTAMNQIYGSSSVNISHHVNKPVTLSNAMRGVSAAGSFAGGPGAIALKLFIVQPLKHALYDYIGDKLNSQTPVVTYDKYTESIVAEVMSYQQPKSKLQSALKFIRPKKKKKLYK
ncbi:hypothetical protein ES705_35517 [subsurface metagenome]